MSSTFENLSFFSIIILECDGNNDTNTNSNNSNDNSSDNNE